MHVAEAKQKLGSRIHWLCDSISNDLKHALGDAPNSEFLVGPDGKIVQARRWSRPQELRQDLASLLGEVARPTTIADVGMKPLEPPKTAAKGIVPRLQLPGRMTAVRVQPLVDSVTGIGSSGQEPFYVKLRAEVDQQYFQNGAGKLYLGFLLDPLYKVPWNNRAAPIQYEIETSNQLEVTPRSATGPDVEEDADADPREFLVDISGRANGPIKLTVKYFACDDAETFCRPVTQHYLISLERDRDGGSRRAFGSRGRQFAGGGPGGFGPGRGGPGRGGPGQGGPGQVGPGRGGPGGRFGPGGFRPFGESTTRPREADPAAKRRSQSLKTAVALIRKYDTNQDGKLEKVEQARIKRPLAQADADSDGKISLKELISWLQESGSSG